MSKWVACSLSMVAVKKKKAPEKKLGRLVAIA
jgi:hypothetical protein